MSVLFLGFISAFANASGISLIFFPELGALAYESFLNPRGKWANSPWFLALTPALTGVIGVCCSITIPYGFASMLSVIGLSVLTVRLLRSPIAPAISAGVLPVVLEVETWFYPPAILLGTSSLAFLCAWRRRWRHDEMPIVPAEMIEATDNSKLALSSDRSWLAMLFGFVTLAMVAVNLSGQKLVLFPPLVVIAYEMFVHTASCPWSRSLWKLPLTCTATAMIGVACVNTIGAGVVSTILSLTLGIATLRLIKLHVPPALAVGLIPQIMDSPEWSFPVAVAIGTALLVAYFCGYRSMGYGKTC